MITQLSTEETRELEHTTDSMIMWISAINDPTIRDKVSKKWFKILCWKDAQNIVGAGVYATAKHMTSLLGFKQNYYVMYWERNATWGVDINGTKGVLYISTKGLTLQLAKGTTESETIMVIDELYKLLIKGTNIETTTLFNSL